VNSLTIREIKLDDIDEFIKILMKVYENKFKVIFKSKLEIGQNTLINDMKTRKKLENNFVVEIDESVIGAITLKTRETQQNFIQTLKIFLKNLGFYHGLRSFFVGGYHQSISDKFIHTDACYIENLFVLPQYRRKGIGLNLLIRAEEFAKKSNKKFLYGFVETSNYNSIKLCLKSGFKEISVKKSMFTKLFFNVPAWIYFKKSL
jgi:GNAT superfamily N-acetyltransferase